MSVRALATVLMLCLAGTLVAADNAALRRELEAVLEVDQRHRGGKGSGNFEEQTALDRANLARVEALVALHGWPRRSQVGDDAAMAAFLVIQHADLATQERYLPMLAARQAEGEALGAWLALLTDRIRVGHGQPQRYGTQFRPDAMGVSRPLPIEDAARVNARRLALGMTPMKPATLAGALDEAGCLALDGTWGLHGVTETATPFCYLPTRDAGRPCTDRAQCDGHCLAGKDARAGQETNGHCAARSFPGACFSYVEKGRASGRVCQ